MSAAAGAAKRTSKGTSKAPKPKKSPSLREVERTSARTPRTTVSQKDRKSMEAFLESLRKDATITAAAKAAEISRSHVYELRDADAEFAAAWDTAQVECVEAVEGKLFQRASNGDSDTAIIFFLKTRKPEVYGDKLRFEEVEKIRREAREAAIEEMKRQVAEMTPEARKVLMAAIPKSANDD